MKSGAQGQIRGVQREPYAPDFQGRGDNMAETACSGDHNKEGCVHQVSYLPMDLGY